MGAPKKITIAAVALAIIAISAFTVSGFGRAGLEDLRPVIGARFPGLVWIDAEGTAQLMRLPEERRPLLVDTREPAEYAVSHLEGARWLDPDEPDFGTLPTPEELGERRVIVYCAVGYRSAAIATELVERGYDASNLERGLFGWANDERPMAGAQPEKVHPYDSNWGRTVRPEVRAEF